RFRREQTDLDGLFRAHHAEIVRYLAGRLGSRQEAADLAGDVFVEAVRSTARLRWRGRPVLAWLYRVASNMAADRVKQRAREVPMIMTDLPTTTTTTELPDMVAERDALQ